MAETIFALASGAGRAGIAIIRISGPEAGAALLALSGKPLPAPRLAARRRLFDPARGVALDDALALFFPAPHSFTGEHVAELHLHGGPALIAAAIAALTRLPGLRPAEPGEFTRRAFENGKLDLTAAEGLADLVDAETEGQRLQAFRQMEGGLAAIYEGWRADLIRAAALLEAEIDFPDEALPGGLAARARPILEDLRAALAGHLDDAHRGERVREGFRIAIIGAPNAGKSSLLNALAQREAAIVSDIPGTTRDVVEVRLVLAGFPVWIADTAGLRAARDAIEAEGVKRALARAGDADLRIGVIDASGDVVSEETLAALREGDLLLLNKADLPPGPAARAVQGLAVSTRSQTGIAALEARLAEIVAAALTREEAPPLTRARHRHHVEEAHAAIGRAIAALDLGAELAAEDLRLAARALGRVTGRVDVEHLLDEIFSRFCIGK